MPIYSDLDLDFNRHPGTGDVMRIVDAQAVKQAIKNILNGKPFDNEFDPDFGTTIDSLLFTNFTVATPVILKRIIEEKLALYEPRATVQEVSINTNPLDISATNMDANRLSINVKVNIIDIGVQTMRIEVTRTR